LAFQNVRNRASATKVIHEPTLSTVMMVEKGILDHKEHPTRMQLWKSLPKGVQYQTFQRVLQYLEDHGTVAVDDAGRIYYTGVNNGKLRRLLESSVSAKKFRAPSGLQRRTES
jgi:response regulator of citrate/malate metabolism